MQKKIKLLTIVINVAFFLIVVGCSNSDDDSPTTVNNESQDKDAFFIEDFESGDFSGTNAEGFHWKQTNRTSIVTSESVVNNGAPVDVPIPEGRNWNPKNGRHSLRFRYPAQDFMSEQRFGLSVAHPELWVKYWLRVPTNYKHTTITPSNSKLFAIWMDAYSDKGVGATVIWEFWGNGSGSELAFHYSKGGEIGHDGPHIQHVPFISEEDKGRWMQLIFHVKAASSFEANDGVIQLWRRWEDEPAFTKYHELLDADIGFADVKGWRDGYLMGWSNSGYIENTEWLIDDIVFSDKSLVPKKKSSIENK